MRRTIETVRRGVRPADPKEPSCHVKVLLWIPAALRMLIGLAGILFFIFAYGKLTNTSLVPEWSQVVLPLTIVTGITLVCTSVAVVLWFVGTVRLVSLQRNERGVNQGADNLIRLAKATIGTNGWVLLVFLFFWLLGVRLQYGPAIPLIYPFTPLIILGCVHLFLAALLVEPEIDSVRSFGFGLSLLVHSTVLILALDSGKQLEGRHWAYVSVPSWVTYAWVLVLCIIRARSILPDLAKAEPQADAKAKARIEGLRRLLQSLIGMGIWSILSCTAHVLLVLRLSSTAIQWGVIFVPAVCGWIAFVTFAAAPMAFCVQECLVELLLLAGVQIPGNLSFQPSTEAARRETEATPLLADSRA